LVDSSIAISGSTNLRNFRGRQFDHGVVFGIRRPDFSTAAGNSALIAGTKSSRRVAAPVPALPTTKKEYKKEYKKE
jgi:hypothetical protein